MQVTVDLIDWAWVKTAPTMRFFLEEMLEQDDADLKFGSSCYTFAGGWSDSAMLYLTVCDAFPFVLKKIDTTEQGQWMAQGLSPLLSLEHKLDELGIQAFPDEGYIASMSPDAIAPMAKACHGLQLDWLASMFDGHMPPDRFQGDRRILLEDYLTQWCLALEMAQKEGMGILVHLG